MKSVRSERVNDSEGVGRENENERGKKKSTKDGVAREIAVAIEQHWLWNIQACDSLWASG